MRFAFTDEQRAFAAAARDLFDRAAGPAQLRAAWASPSGRVEGLWPQLAEMGVAGMLAPAAVGGLGLTETDLVLVLCEAGRAAVPEPLTDVALVAVPAIRDHARTATMGESDAEVWLERISAGAATVGVGLLVDGTVLAAADARLFLLEAEDGLHLVDPDVVELEELGSVDGSRRLARVRWTPSPATLLGGGAAAAEQATCRAALGLAAELCGLAERMVEMTVAYVSERRQFGVPVGSFQAVKHQLASAYLSLEFAKPLVWRAAVSVATADPDAPLHASMAKASAGDAAAAVSAAALQCHGAIGYTVEYDLHLFMKRAWALERRAGTSAWHRRRVEERLLRGAPR